MSGSNLTRIQNNQITDSTIQAQAKLAAGSITGNLLASSVTFNSNITILGNLTVANSYTQLNSINTYINDPIVVFNNGYTGSLTGYDMGILVNRNLSSLGGYGSVNTAWIWSEADGAFEAVATTDTGTGITSLNNSGWANVKLGNLTAVGVSITNNLTAGSITGTPISGSTGAFTTAVATNFSTGNAVISGGYISSLANATITAATLTTAVATNLSSGNAVITGGYATGLANVYATTAQATNFSSGNVLITGGSITGLSAFSATTLQATNFSTGNAVISGGYISSLANATITAATLTTAVATNFSTANAVITGGSLNGTAIGATTPSTGNFSTLQGTNFSTGNAVITTEVATNLSSGNVAITGGYLTGLANVYATTAQATNFSTGNAVITGGYASGLANVYATTGVITNFSTANAVITGGSLNGTPVGATTASTGAFTTLTTTGTAIASGNIVANAGTASTNTTTGALVVKGGAGISGALNVGGDAKISGNLEVDGTLTYINTTTEVVSGVEVVAGNLVANSGTASTNTTTGALVVAGGAGISGALNVGGIIGASSVQNTPIGTTTPSTGYFTTAYATNFSTGNAVISNASFTTEVATNFSTANAVITGGSVNGTPVGATTASTGAFTTLSTSGVTTHNGNLVAASGTSSTSTTTGALVVVGGAGVSGNINVGSSSSTHSMQGNVLIGAGTAFAGTLTAVEINQNTDAPQSANSTLHISAKTSSNGKVTVDSFGTGSASYYVARSSRGTSAAPSASQTGDLLGAFIASGYGATGYISGNAKLSPGISVLASQNFTDTAQGTNININYVPDNSNVAVTGIQIGSVAGNVIIPSTTGTSSATTGALVVAGGIATNNNLYVNGTSTFGGVTTHASNVVIASATQSTSTTTGALVLVGGLGMQGDMYTTGIIHAGTALNYTPASANVQIGGQVNSFLQTVIQNASGGNNASSDVAAVANNGSDNDTYVDMGITSSTYSQAGYTLYGANDGYLIVSGNTTTGGGNLILNTYSAKDIIFATGGTQKNNEVARITSGNVFVLKSTINPSPAANVGSFQNWGSSSITGNSYIGGATVFNGSATAGNDVIAKGASDTTLVWARPSSTYDQVLIGGSASVSTLVRGAKLQINSTDSILIPVGTNAQRPGNSGGTDTQGMLRYNSTINGMEIFTGTVWQAFSTSFTVIADQQFNGTGSQTAFTLSTSQTTASCIVSVNGVLQIPTLAYSVSGTTLTFTEAPASTDVIDVRCLTTTATVTSIASTNGYMGFATDNYGANIYTGSGSQTLTVSYNAAGAAVGFLPNVSVASANSPTTIDTIDTTQYRSAKYVIQVTNGANYQVMEALVISNGTTATITTYGTLATGGNLGVLSATQSGSNALVQFIAANATNNVRISKNYLAI